MIIPLFRADGHGGVARVYLVGAMQRRAPRLREPVRPGPAFCPVCGFPARAYRHGPSICARRERTWALIEAAARGYDRA